jgi:hypothetical protein
MMHAAVRRLREALHPTGAEGRRAKRPVGFAAELAE